MKITQEVRDSLRILEAEWYMNLIHSEDTLGSDHPITVTARKLWSKVDTFLTSLGIPQILVMDYGCYPELVSYAEEIGYTID